MYDDVYMIHSMQITVGFPSVESRQHEIYTKQHFLHKTPSGPKTEAP